MRVYRALLRLLPLEFRERFGAEMEGVFRAERREAAGAGIGARVRVWGEALVGLVAVAPREHLAILAQDLTLARRLLANRPAFAVTAIGVLALGIGATTAAFAVVDGVLLRPLPYPDPERIVTVAERERGGGVARVSPAMLIAWQTDARAFAHLAGLNGDRLTLTAPGGSVGVRVLAVDPALFDVYGLPMALGRPLAAVPPQGPSANEVVLSHAYWQRQFGGDPGVLGRRVPFVEGTLTVVGVASRHLTPPEETDVFNALTFKPELLRPNVLGARYLGVVGRLRPAAAAATAEAELSAITARLAASAGDDEGARASVVTLREQLVARYRQTLWLLFGGVVLLLVVASTNVSSLLLARMATRGDELALRAALGASWARLFRQVVTESLLMAALAGIAGLTLAWLALPALLAWVPAAVPRLADVTLGVRAIGFALLASILSGVALGIAPAARVSTERLSAALSGVGRQASARSTRRGRNLLLALETALTVVLLAGGLVMARGLATLRQVDLGFNPSHLLTAFVSLPDVRYPTADAQRLFVDRLIAELDAMPGVTAAGVDCNAPLSDALMWFRYRVDGHDTTAAAQPMAQYHCVAGRPFAAMQTRILEGRGIDAADQTSGRPVAVVNQWIARRYWPGRSPVGRSIAVSSRHGMVRREIVGVAASLRHQSLTDPEGPEIYVPFGGDPWSFLHFAVRIDDLHESAPARLRAAAARVDPALALESVLWMDERVASVLAPTRFQAWLLGGFAAMALLLALVCIHGVMSYAVSLRTSELGVRMALGAQAGAVAALVVRDALGPVLAGLAAGVAAVLLLGGTIPLEVAGLRPTDPGTLVGAALLLLAAALVATWLPARRAARVDPLVALRAR